MIINKKTNEGKIAKIELNICDQSQIGVSYCGLCGQVLLNLSKTCPSCKATFDPTVVINRFNGNGYNLI